MLQKLKPYDILIVTETSRMGRNLAQIMSILNFCIEQQVKVYAIKEGYELGDNINSKVLAIANGIFEKLQIKIGLDIATPFPYIRPMKFFAFIFAFYILSISTMPCNDVHDGAKGSISTIEQAQDHHESDNDVCSPFCICSCCQGFVALTSIPDVMPSTFTFAIGFAHYTEKFFSSSFAAIWQPPRLG